MCIIMVKPAGVEFPNHETFSTCDMNNSDGCGLAYHKGGDKVYIKKDFANVNDMYAFIKARLTKDDPAIVHFRLATSGLVDFGNRHPFPVVKDEDMLRSPEIVVKSSVVAHNGIFHEWNNVRDSILSDTQLFIKEVLSDSVISENMTNPAIRRLLGDFIGSNKLAILAPDGKLTTWGHFEKSEDGVFYSNSSYKEARIRQISYASLDSGYFGDWREQKDDCVSCELCAEPFTDEVILDDVLTKVCDLCKELIEKNYN